MQIKCPLCNQPAFNLDGSPNGEVHVYQILDGKPKIASSNLVLGKPMINIHKDCKEAL